LEFAGGVYHVMNRGLERREIVHDDFDRQTWLQMLDRAASRYEWRVFAYVLLDNHFHLFLRIAQPNLALGMHDFESGFASIFNRRHERNGPLLQGRYKAILVQLDSYAWELSRYLHLNPVRAGLTDDPFQYAWSSCRFYLNPRRGPAWLDWKTILTEIGGTLSAARLAYRRFIEAGVSNPPENPFDQTVDGQALGSAEFIDEMQAALEAQQPIETLKAGLTVSQVVAAVADAFRVNTERVRSRGHQDNRAREAALLLARELTSEKIIELGASFGGVCGSAVTEAVRRARERAETDQSFRERLDKLRIELRS